MEENLCDAEPENGVFGRSSRKTPNRDESWFPSPLTEAIHRRGVLSGSKLMLSIGIVGSFWKTRTEPEISLVTSLLTSMGEGYGKIT